ncbi:MAG: porin [Rubrivivax sp.]
MKKSVLALAVLGAFAGVASAQSSVTLFGVVDLNIMSVDNDARTYSMGTDGMSSSRLGFRGIEDLGGGLKASFWLEAGLAPDTGNGAAKWGNGSRGDDALVFNRRSTVSLQNAMGELRLGRDYTATFWSWTVFDPFGTNGVGAATNLAIGTDLATALSGTTYGTLVRANNMVQYILPAGVFGPGLYGQLQVAAGEGAFGNRYYGGRIGYAAGPFDIAAAYGTTQLSPNIDLDNWNVGGSWNFGFMKLSGFYSQIDAQGVGNNQFGRDNWFVGVSAPFGQWNFKASYGATNADGSGVASPFDGADATQWALGADYNLSKRTALYGTWSSINNDANARFAVSLQSNTPAATTPFNSNGIQIGVRHSF